MSNVQTREAQLNLFLPSESCCVSHNSLHNRCEKIINCLLETGLGAVDFLIRIKRKALKHIQYIIVRALISNIFYQ